MLHVSKCGDSSRNFAWLRSNGITGCVSITMSSRYARASGGLRAGCVTAAKVRNVPRGADAPSNACLAGDTSPKMQQMYSASSPTCRDRSPVCVQTALVQHIDPLTICKTSKPVFQSALGDNF